MSTLHRDIHIQAPAEVVWDALRDVGRPHERITPGVLVDTSFDGSIRTVTFADGFTARERIVDVDDAEMRVAYAVIDGPFEHHHASMQVIEHGDGTSSIAWRTDLLPEELVALVTPLVEAGAAAMQRTLAADAAARAGARCR
jgi:hypothetical protein